MKVSEAIWMRDRMGSERVGADQAHQEGGGVEDRDFEGERCRDRQAEPPELAEARPVRPPEPSEQAVAAEAPVRMQTTTARPRT